MLTYLTLVWTILPNSQDYFKSKFQNIYIKDRYGLKVS